MTDFQEQKVGSLTVRIDRSTCIGTSNCAKVAPETAVEACQVCPVDALAAFDADGRQLAP